MASRDTVTDLAEQLALAFLRLESALETPEGQSDLLRELGWDFPVPPAELDALVAPVAAVTAFADLEELSDSQIPELLAAAAGAFSAIANTNLPGDVNGEFSKQLADFVVVHYFFEQQPVWGFLLLLLGIVSLEQVPAPPAGRLPYVAYSFAYAQIPNLISDPLPFLKTQYRWGQSDFKGDLLLGGLEGLLDAWQFPVRRGALGGPFLAQLQQGALSPSTASASPLWLVLVESAPSPAALNMSMGLYLLPETASAKPGFALLPVASAGFNQDIDIGESLVLSLSAELDLTGGVGIFVRPNQEVAFIGGLASGAPSPIAGALAVQLKLQEPGEPIVILGLQEGSRLQVAGLSATGGIRLAGGGREVFTELATEGGRIIVDPGSDGDGFLASLLPAGGIDTPFNLTVGFSTSRGLYFNAAGGFEITIPTHFQVGPLELQSVAIAVKPSTGAIPIDVSAAFAADLSVLKASVEGVGLTAKLTFRNDRKGNLGPVDLALGFKPPTGVGIAINAGPVSGGGFLSFEDHKYSGALALQVYSVAVKAFGIIETKFPDGRPGFSFIIIISAEFTPIQLGFGFTLLGVGGIIGINRDLNEDALRDAVQRGALGNVLFPKDPIRDAPTILHDIEEIFPPTEGRYAFGPLARIGWGTPPILDARLGIVIVFPGPRIALLGTITVLFPPGAPPETRLVEIHLDIDGILDFPKKHFQLDAHLHDSQVRGFPISGDMAMRMDWGQNPNFLIAHGGFHPHYTPPAGFPKLRRLSIDLGIHGNPSATLSGYMAVTSNTAQIGAALDVHASKSGASLSGGLAFDALFVFSPFSFEASLEGGVHVDFHGAGFGMHFHGKISGPAPWHLEGDVCVSVLWWDACVGFSVTLGGEDKPLLPEIDVWDGSASDAEGHQDVPGLKAALLAPGNWTGVLPPNGYQAVVIRDTDSSAASRVDPLGVATFQQKVLPFKLAISKFAGRDRAKNNAVTVTVTKIVVDGDNLLLTQNRTKEVSDFFAPAQYQKLPDSQALSSPSFQPMQAGFSLSSNDLKSGTEKTKDITFKTIVVGTPGFVADFPVKTEALLLAMVGRSAVALSGLRTGNIDRFVDFGADPVFTLADEVYALALKSNLKRYTPDTDPDGPYALKADKLATYPADVRATLQIVPLHELAA